MSSVVLEFENNNNPYAMRKLVIEDFLSHANEYVEENSAVIDLAKSISATGVKPKDAAHLACAIHAGCDYFLSTDDRLLKYKDSRIQIMNPVDFVVKGGTP